MSYERQNDTLKPDELIEKSIDGTQLSQLLRQSGARHNHLCPRQVLGVRMSILAGQTLELHVPDVNKRLLTLVETDGCVADAVSLASGCTVGNRKLRVVDFGKVAATFVDMKCNTAIRIAPKREIRAASQTQFPEAKNRWHAQMKAYQLMPYSDLLEVQQVALSISLEKLLSKPGYRVLCGVCGEEVINEREIILDGTILCRGCAGHNYYRLTEKANLPLTSK